MVNALSVISTLSSLNIFGVGFTLGSFNFNGAEVPEMLNSLGGTQAIAVHEFPGSYKTIQTYGVFPEAIRFRGIMLGNNAFTRVQALDRLRIAQRPTTLAYARFAYYGVISELKINPKHQWHIEYQLTFEPQQDLANGSTGLTPADTPDSLFATQLGTLTNLLSGTPFALPSGLVASVTNLANEANSALAQFGQLAQFTTEVVNSIATLAGTVVNTASGLYNSASALVSAPALSSSAAAASLAALAQSPTASTVTINVVNPNLFMLAAQYLGSASLWQTIATANGLVDPMPIGKFNLVIPG